MNRLAGLPVLLLACAALAGCVSYSYPERYDLGSRHTHYEPVYARNYSSDYRYSIGLSGAYYPWWSVDYFYLGHHYYRPVGYWGHRYGYAPYYPYYYRPWRYSSHAWGWPYWGSYPGYGWVGYDSYWHYRYRQHVYDPPRHRQPSGGDGGYRPPPAGSAGDHLVGPGNRRGIGDRVPDRDRMRRSRSGQSDRTVVPEQRTVTVAPRGRADDRGMVVISRGDNKVKPSRPEPNPRSIGSARGRVTGAGAEPAHRSPPAALPGRQAAPARQTAPVRYQDRSKSGPDRRSRSFDGRPTRRADDSGSRRAGSFRERDRDRD